MSTTLKPWSEILENLFQGKDLSSLEASSLMQAWLSEDLSPVQTGAFLAALRSKGLKGSELASMAEILRQACSLPCTVPFVPMIDTCGTGGDGADTFNISTAVAFVASASGLNVAKHGNRSASGKVGSADVLEALGLNLKAPLDRVISAINKAKITFLFAPAWHPALVNLAPLRKTLGVRTVFNLLGPLVNPLKPNAQVLGVARPELLDPMAEALQKLGLKRAIVVHGEGGLDEASLSGVNQLRFLDNGSITASTITASDVGLNYAPNQDLIGGDLQQNQNILTKVLKGHANPSQINVVALNTSLVFWASGLEDDLKKGTEIALNCIETGKPWITLECLKEVLLSEEN